MRNIAVALTSASTALYQNVSEKVNVKAPINALPKIATRWFLLIVLLYKPTTFFKIFVLLQNINNMVNALETAATIFTIYAIYVLSGTKIEKNAPNIWYRGAPGGCPTCNLVEVAIYSPASQKLNVGSKVNT